MDKIRVKLFKVGCIIPCIDYWSSQSPEVIIQNTQLYATHTNQVYELWLYQQNGIQLGDSVFISPKNPIMKFQEVLL